MAVWVILAIGLVTCTFGALNSLSLIVSICITFAVGFASLRTTYSEESNDWWTAVHLSNVNRGDISKISDNMVKAKCQNSERTKISGAPIIDEELHIIVNYIIRDFVIDWYKNISGHPDFVLQVQHSLKELLVAISERFKSTDWFGYLTNQFVEDIADHLDLFRSAKTANKNKDPGQQDIVTTFFEKEAMRHEDTKRENICLDKDAEIDYLSDLVEILLYFLLSPEDFMNIPLRTAIVEVLVSTIIMPLVDQLSHEHAVNSLIVLGCSGFDISPDLFLQIIRTTTNAEELEAVKKSIEMETRHLRSQDCSGREQGAEAKQQIGSLEYLKQVVNTQIQRLSKGSETDSIGMPSCLSYKHLSRKNLFQLPLQAILQNSLTLDHFLSYMNSISCLHYVNLHLDIESWKCDVSEHLDSLELEKINNFHDDPADCSMPDMCHDYFAAQDLSIYKSKAEDIYDIYLSEKAEPRVDIDDSILKRFILTLRTESISESWFDEIHQYLLNSLRDVDEFLPGFKRSDWYIKLLAELDLLKDATRSDEDDSQSLDELSAGGSDQNTGSNCSPYNLSPATSHNPSPCHSRVSSLSSKTHSLSAYISKIDIIKERNRSYAKYRIVVTKTITDQLGLEETWHVTRRYSEFYDFHANICGKFADLNSIPFPSKKMVNNLAAWFLEKRMGELNKWLSCLLDPPVIHSHPGLQEEFLKFFDQYNFQSQPVKLSTKVRNNFVAPIGSGVRTVGSAVKSVPDTVFNTVDGLYKKLNRPAPPPKGPFLAADANQRGSFDTEVSEENIALRILLVLMDKVFDLSSKDQWFRRRIILFLRQILKAMFGDIVNRRINDYISFITSAEQVSQYLQYFKDTTWPGGKLAPPTLEKDEDHQLRTKIAAKACLLGCISDEFKALLGSQTTSRGVLNVYECVQWQPINKRLIYLLLTGILEKIFLNQQSPDIFRSLICTSSRRTRNQTVGSRRSTRVTM